MSSKPESQLNAAPMHFDTPFALTGPGMVRVGGRDAADFLQRQTMNDVRLLDRIGTAQFNGLLSAKGRVLSLFRLLRCATDEFVLVCFCEDAEWLVEHLRRGLFRSKASVAVDRDHVVVGTCSRVAAETADGGYAWDSGRWIALMPAAKAAVAIPDAQAFWRDTDLLRGLVHLSDSTRDRYTPHMLGLDARAAFSLNKGCYPGQEIVARTHYLGQQKRHLLRITGARRALHAGDAILDAGVEVGRVVCSAQSLQVGALAVLNGGASAALTVDGVAVEALPVEPLAWPA